MTRRERKKNRRQKLYVANPPMSICYWCGGDRAPLLPVTNEGELIVDRVLDLPPRVLVDYDPCEACRAKFSEGILIAEVERETTPREDQLQLFVVEGLYFYPTGRWVATNEDSIREIVDDPTQMLENRYGTLEREAFELFFGDELRKLQEADLQNDQE